MQTSTYKHIHIVCIAVYAVFWKDTDGAAKNKRLWVKGFARRPHARWISLRLESSVKLPAHTGNHTAHTIYSPFVILTLLQSLEQLEWILALVSGDCGLKLRPLLFQIFTSHVTPHTSHAHILSYIQFVSTERNEFVCRMSEKGKGLHCFLFLADPFMSFWLNVECQAVLT